MVSKFTYARGAAKGSDMISGASIVSRTKGRLEYHIAPLAGGGAGVGAYLKEVGNVTSREVLRNVELI